VCRPRRTAWARAAHRARQGQDPRWEGPVRSTFTGTETELPSRLDDWAHAVRARDVERIFTHYAPDIVAFDAIAQLQFKDAEAYDQHREACMTMCLGPMSFELHELQVTAGDELAFVLGLKRCGVCWQIIPRALTEALAAEGDEARRAFDAMMTMVKIDLAAIEAARRNEPRGDRKPVLADPNASGAM